MEYLSKLSALEEALKEEKALKRAAEVPRHCYRINLPSINLPSIVHSARVGLPPLFQHIGSDGSSSFRLLGIVGFAEHSHSKKGELIKDSLEEYVLSRKEYAEKMELVQRLLGYKPMWLNNIEHCG